MNTSRSAIRKQLAPKIAKYSKCSSSHELSKNSVSSIWHRSSVIVSLVEGRGSARGEIGMASIDAVCSEISLCQFTDSASYARLRAQLQICDPVEVIVPETAADRMNNMNAIIEIINSTHSDVEITMVERRYFNDLKGAELVDNLADFETSKLMPDFAEKYYCMAATAALIKYVEHVQNVMFAHKSLNFTYQVVENTCFIDVNTMRNMEIVEREHLIHSKLKRSLFALLNSCLTNGGVRMLRSNLLQPSADLGLINSRLDSIEELLEDNAKLQRLRKIIGGVSDIQQLMTVCCYENTEKDTLKNIEHRIVQVLNLRQTLMTVTPLREELKDSRASIFRKCYEHLCDSRFDRIIEAMNRFIHSSVGIEQRTGLCNWHRRCYVIREGLSSVIDLMRKGYEEILVDMREWSDQEKKDIPEARLAFTSQRKFHYSLACTDPVITMKLPVQFIEVVRNRTTITFTTRSLIRYSERLAEIVDEIMINSNPLLIELLIQLRPMIPCLYHIIEAISLVDFLTSLALYSMKYPSVRPKFSPIQSMIIKGARHPLLDATIQNVAPNDVYLAKESRFSLITGPNMAGKSTYLKLICVMQVLAQTGCFVPAELAVFPVITKIFSRVGQNDDFAANLSSFSLEMSEMAMILKMSNDLSLIIVDELARSTSFNEGVALCFALAEELLKKKGFVVFATHYLQLSTLSMLYPAVENYHFMSKMVQNGESSKPKVPKVQSDHFLQKGPFDGPSCAFDLAEFAALPSEIIVEARSQCHELLDKQKVHSNYDPRILERNSLIRLASKLRSILPLLMQADDEHVKNYFKLVREQLLSLDNNRNGQ